jgi:phytoene dehydrogenase-like protein
MDYALADAVPWKAEECRRAATVHLGASLGEIGGALAAVASGRPPDPPFLIVAQPTIVDPSRAPAGRHVLWAYGHVPPGWRGDLSTAIENQIERFAPGFRDLVLARSAWGPPQLEAHNRSMIDGDIAGGVFRGRQMLFRPVVARVPYATPDPTIFLCSAATPPGPGVHGMGGHLAAQVALRRVFGLSV